MQGGTCFALTYTAPPSLRFKSPFVGWTQSNNVVLSLAKRVTSARFPFLFVIPTLLYLCFSFNVELLLSLKQSLIVLKGRINRKYSCLEVIIALNNYGCLFPYGILGQPWYFLPGGSFEMVSQLKIDEEIGQFFPKSYRPYSEEKTGLPVRLSL